MNGSDFWDLPIGLQAALGFGYLAYLTAYAGMRRAHTVQDALFLTLAFGSLTLLSFSTLSERGNIWALSGALGASLAAAALWRLAGRSAWQWFMGFLGVHRDDGLFHGWDAIVQTKKEVGQVSVHTKDGRTLYLNDREKYRLLPWQGLYLGGDGSVIMVVEEEDLPDGTEEERTGILHEKGARMTYIPAAEVSRVNIRMR